MNWTTPIIPNSVCLIFSGKRKSGKDYTVNRLSQFLKDENVPHIVLHISSPIKSQYALEHSLDFAELLSSSSYKEQFRAQMVRWAEQKMQADPYVFARTALNESLKSCPNTTQQVLVIVADARRPTDLTFFTKTFSRSSCLLVRIVAPVHVRTQRGWTYVRGIDDAKTECGLDDITDWDIVLNNDGDEESFSTEIHKILLQAKNLMIGEQLLNL